MSEPLPEAVEKLIRELQADSIGTRKRAVEGLAQVSESNLRIVQSLSAVEGSDPSFVIREAANRSLRAPVHQETLRQYRYMLAQEIKDDSVVEKGLRSTARLIIGAIVGVIIGTSVMVLLGIAIEDELSIGFDYSIVARVGAILGGYCRRCCCVK